MSAAASLPLQSSISKIVTGTNKAKLSGSFLNFSMEDFTQQCAPCLDVSWPPSIAALPSSSQSFWEKETVSGGVVWESRPYSSVKERRANLCRDVLAPHTVGLDSCALFCCHPRPTEQGGVGKPGTSLPQPATVSMAQSALWQNSIDVLLLRGQGWKEGKTGPGRSLRAALLLWCSAADLIHPLQSMKAYLTLCQSDSLFPPREKFCPPAMTGQPCCGSPHSCRETGLLMVPCI